MYLSSWMVVLSLAVDQIQKLKTKLLMYNKDYKVYGSNLGGRPGRWFGSGRARPREEFEFTFKVK